MPYAEQAMGDPRPLVLGEYFFPVCHEQTDVRVNPGLREYFGAGHGDPASPWGRECALAFAQPYTKPVIPPGAWTHIVRSSRVSGGAIWAAFTNLSELRFTWRLSDHAGGTIAVAAAPGGKRMLEIPIPAGTRAGTQSEIDARDRHYESKWTRGNPETA